MSEEILYIIRDPSGAIYGPANIPTLRQWIAEGRISQQMFLAPQGTQNFLPATQILELAPAFAALQSPASSPPSAPAQQQYQQPPSQQQQYQQQQYQQQYGYPGQQGYANYATKSSGMAIASLVCSLCSFVACGVPAILGIIFGHMARAQIRREPDRYEGAGMALAGLIIGYIVVALGLAYIAFIIVMIAIGEFH